MQSVFIAQNGHCYCQETLISKKSEELTSSKATSTIKNIKLNMYVRISPRNPKNMCAVKFGSGGSTKGFATRNYLAIHVYRTFGEQWATKIKFKPNKEKNYTISSNFICLGTVKHGKINYLIYSPTGVGSIYHSFSELIKPSYVKNPPDAQYIRDELVEYISKTNIEITSSRMEVNCLSTIFKEKFLLITVESEMQLYKKSFGTMHGRTRDGKKKASIKKISSESFNAF